MYSLHVLWVHILDMLMTEHMGVEHVQTWESKWLLFHCHCCQHFLLRTVFLLINKGQFGIPLSTLYIYILMKISIATPYPFFFLDCRLMSSVMFDHELFIYATKHRWNKIFFLTHRSCFKVKYLFMQQSPWHQLKLVYFLIFYLYLTHIYIQIH